MKTLLLFFFCGLALPALLFAESLPGYGAYGGLSGQSPILVAQASGNNLTLGDLGFEQEKAQVDPQKARIIEQRRQILERHQLLGLITAGLMLATLSVADSAEDSDLHPLLGMATAGMYFTTASYAIRAPAVEGVEHKGGSAWHARLALVHGPGMILTAAAGYLARSQEKKGEEPSGLAAQHSTLASVTFLSFASAVALISFEF